MLKRKIVHLHIVLYNYYKEVTTMTELRDRYIRFDWAIKRLLRQKAGRTHQNAFASKSFDR